MSHKRERAAIGIAMLQAATNLLEQVSVEVKGDLMDPMRRDERAVLRTLERMRQKLLLVYDAEARKRGSQADIPE